MVQIAKEIEKMFKIALIGDKDVGKTAIRINFWEKNLKKLLW